MNILELTDEYDQLQAQNCKAYYLKLQNKLMKNQYQALSQISSIYKKILSITTNQQKVQEDEKEIELLLNQSNKVIEKWEEQWQKFMVDKQEQRQPLLSTEFFMEMVISYEKAITEIKGEIHQRQIVLQQLENGNNHPLKAKDTNYENNVVVKAIESYDIYNRLADRCRNEIVELKLRKKKMENSRLDKFYGKKSQTEIQKQSDKTIKKRPAYSQDQNQQISHFQKTVLLYKKKKLFNQMRESKLIQLKKRIKQKQCCNQILRKKLENENWDNLVEMDFLTNHEAVEQMGGSFSVVNQPQFSMYCDFSVDLSRVLPETLTKKKNYAEYKAEQKH